MEKKIYVRPTLYVKFMNSNAILLSDSSGLKEINGTYQEGNISSKETEATSNEVLSKSFNIWDDSSEE